MKNLNLQSLFRIGGFIPILVLLTVSITFFTINFIKYQNANILQEKIELAKALDNVIANIGRERGKSSIFFASKGKYPKSKELVKIQRSQTDLTIQSLKNVLNKYPDLNTPQLQQILNYLNNINIIREKIDTFKLSFKSWFFNYYSKMDSLIYNYEAQLFNLDNNTLLLTNPISPNIEQSIVVKQNLRKAIENLGRQRGYLSFVATQNMPISKEDYHYVFFDWYFNDKSLPLAILSSNENIRKIFYSADYKAHIATYRQILYMAQKISNLYTQTKSFNGYPINSLEIFASLTKRINDIIKVNNILTNKIYSELDEISQNALDMLIISSVLMILSIIFFIIYILIEKSINTNFVKLNELAEKLLPLANEGNELNLTKPKTPEEAYFIVNTAIENAMKLTKQAEEMNKIKSSFLANISHKIRTPLNGILGFLDLLKTTKLDEEQMEYINTISTSSNSLSEIVNNILDVSKIQSNKIELELIPFKPINEFESVIESFSSQASDKNITLVSFIDPSISKELKGDIVKIKEVMHNILSNAIKFTEEGHIAVTIKQISIKENKAKLYFEIKDTGIGISIAQQDIIFSAFSESDISMTSKYIGTGLGLTISSKYIELMGGKIELESKINEGSKFFFEIELDVLDEKETFPMEAFEDLKIALFKPTKENIRIDYLSEYFNYTKTKALYFNSIEKLKEIITTEPLSSVSFVYDKSINLNDYIEYLSSAHIKYTFLSDIKNKPKIENSPYKPIHTIWDPINPTKVYNMLDEIKNSKLSKNLGDKDNNEQHFDLTVLVVEDNPINQKLIKLTLEQLGIKVVLANNGLEALNKYSINPENYDLIFMDIQMPIMDGVEATHEILDFEEDEEIEHTPIIALTANVLKGDKERFLSEGMDEYITKPIKKDEIFEVIKKFDKLKYASKQQENEDDDLDLELELEIEPKKPNKNIIVATKNILNTNILNNYLEKFGYTDIHHIKNIKELGKSIDTNKENILFIDDDFIDGIDMSDAAKQIKEKIPNITIVTFSDKTKIDNIDYILNSVNKQTLSQIL